MLEVDAGRRELGKSTLAYHRSLSRPRRVIWDPRCFWRATDGRVVYGGIHGIPLEEFPDSLALAWTVAPEIVIQPDAENDDDNAEAEHWRWFARLLRSHLLRHPHDAWAVLVDEFGEVDRNWPNAAWRFFVKSVPRIDVDIYITCHKPIDVHPRMRSIVDRWCLFQTVDPDDLKMLRRRSVPEEIRAALPTLPPYVFYEWNEATGRGRYVNDSAAWKETLTPPMVSIERRRLFSLGA